MSGKERRLLYKQLLEKCKNMSELSYECQEILSKQNIDSTLHKIVNTMPDEKVRENIKLNKKDKKLISMLKRLPPQLIKHQIIDNLDLKDIIRLKIALNNDSLNNILSHFKKLLIGEFNTGYGIKDPIYPDQQSEIDYEKIWQCMLYGHNDTYNKIYKNEWHKLTEFIVDNNLRYEWELVQQFDLSLGEYDYPEAKKEIKTLTSISHSFWSEYIQSEYIPEQLEEQGLGDWKLPKKSVFDESKLKILRMMCGDHIYLEDDIITMELHSDKSGRYLILLFEVDYITNKNLHVRIYRENTKKSLIF